MDRSIRQILVVVHPVQPYYASVKHKPIQRGAYHLDNIIMCQKPNYYLIIIQPPDEQNKITMWHYETKSDRIYFYFFLSKKYKALKKV